MPCRCRVFLQSSAYCCPAGWCRATEAASKRPIAGTRSRSRVPYRWFADSFAPTSTALGTNPARAGSAGYQHFVEQDQAEDRANPGDGWQAVERLGSVLLRRVHDRQLEVCQPRVVVADQGHVTLEALWHRGSRTALGDAGPVGWVGDVLANLGEVVLALGVVDMGQEFCPLAPQRHATSHEVTGGTHGGGIDVGVWEHPSAERVWRFSARRFCHAWPCPRAWLS
jgi:hypothetical protein